jgi:hypothetical protein
MVFVNAGFIDVARCLAAFPGQAHGKIHLKKITWLAPERSRTFSKMTESGLRTQNKPE